MSDAFQKPANPLQELIPRTLDRYLFSQLFSAVLFFVALCTILFLAPEVLYKLIQYVFSGQVSPLMAGKMLLFHLPAALQQSIPAAVLLGCLLVFQRMSQQFELIALFSSGISKNRMLLATIYTGLIFAVLHGFVQEGLTPYTAPVLENEYRQITDDIRDRNFVFVEKAANDHISTFFLIGQAQNTALTDFIVLYYTPDNLGGDRITRIIRAKTGSWDRQTGLWQLKDGLTYTLNDSGVYQNIQHFDTQDIRISRYAAKLLTYSKTNPKNLGWLNMAQYIRLMKEGGQLQDVGTFEIRLWQKLVAPLTSIVFAILGALFGVERVRTNRSFGLIFGVLVIATYSFLTPFVSNLGILSFVPGFIVAWIPLAGCLLLAAGLLKLKSLNF